jgi:hypothetical protein
LYDTIIQKFPLDGETETVYDVNQPDSEEIFERNHQRRVFRHDGGNHTFIAPRNVCARCGDMGGARPVYGGAARGLFTAARRAGLFAAARESHPA